MTSKLIPAIVLTIGLFGAMVGRVEGHGGTTENHGGRHTNNPLDHAPRNIEGRYSDHENTWLLSWDAPIVDLSWPGHDALFVVEIFRNNEWVSLGTRGINRNGFSSRWVDSGSSIQVRVVTKINHSGTESDYIYMNAVTISKTTNPETPIDPDPEDTDPPTTPTEPEPETPAPPPSSSTCIYEHRLIGVPSNTAGGYTARIMVGSRLANATATIRAYSASNGSGIDVFDADTYSPADPEDSVAITNPIALTPAHSVKRFLLEPVRGWHTVIVEHASERAMKRATVAMLLRGPDIGVTIIPAQMVEHCEPAAETNGE